MDGIRRGIVLPCASKHFRKRILLWDHRWEIHFSIFFFQKKLFPPSLVLLFLPYVWWDLLILNGKLIGHLTVTIFFFLTLSVLLGVACLANCSFYCRIWQDGVVIGLSEPSLGNTSFPPSFSGQEWEGVEILPWLESWVEIMTLVALATMWANDMKNIRDPLFSSIFLLSLLTWYVAHNWG